MHSNTVELSCCCEICSDLTLYFCLCFCYECQGNKSFARVDGKVVPVIFDPATYYGDREADVAMTYLFGGFGSDFYDGYESEWPLPEVS